MKKVFLFSAKSPIATDLASFYLAQKCLVVFLSDTSCLIEHENLIEYTCDLSDTDSIEQVCALIKEENPYFDHCLFMSFDLIHSALKHTEILVRLTQNIYLTSSSKPLLHLTTIFSLENNVDTLCEIQFSDIVAIDFIEETLHWIEPLSYQKIILKANL